MLAIILLIILFAEGCLLVDRFLGRIYANCRVGAGAEAEFEFGRCIIAIPAGCLIAIWLGGIPLYLCCYLFSSSFPDYALMSGDLCLALAGGGWIALRIWRSRIAGVNSAQFLRLHLSKFVSMNRADQLFMLVSALISYRLMAHSFTVKSNKIAFGNSVYSDYANHISLIRSFSYGVNIPTDFPYFPGAGIKYHFLFDFLAANLELLGLRVDWAYNILGTVAFWSMLNLAYALALTLFADRAVAWVALVLTLFRSSFSIFLLALNDPGRALQPGYWWETLTTRIEFFGESPGEAWGFWTLNDFLNQRHLGLGCAIMCLALLYALPLLRDPGVESSHGIRKRLLSKEAWAPSDWPGAVTMGIVLGLSTYINAAIVIAATIILSSMAVFSWRRLELILIVGITTFLSTFQAHFFAGTGTPISPKLTIGFLAFSSDPYKILEYYRDAFGILPAVLAFAFLLSPARSKGIFLCFATPIVFANLVSLSDDVMLNYKYVKAGILLLNPWAAALLLRLARCSLAGEVLGVILAFLLTITGTFDWQVIENKNRITVEHDQNDPLFIWVRDKTPKASIFLTAEDPINAVLLAGRRIFNGYGYFTAGLGYDPGKRRVVTAQIYAARDATVRELAKTNKIDYILYDFSVASATYLKADLDGLKRIFPVVWTDQSTNRFVFKVE